VATGRIYIWGEPDYALVGIMLSLAAATALGFAAWKRADRARVGRGTAVLRLYGGALALAWCATSLAALELAASWPFPSDYATSVPRYLRDIAAPNTQPWPLALAAVAWLAWRSGRDERARLLALAFVLFLPFALHTANRSLSYRDSLPLVYLAYIGAGGLVVHLLRQLPAQSRTAAVACVVAGFALLGALQTRALTVDWLPHEEQSINAANWDNPLVADAAAWMRQHVPEGAAIMSSRLYFSHLYVLDEGKHPIYQLPTVRVEPRAGETPFLSPASTLFRWEDHDIAPLQSDDWLHVQRFPGKSYYVGLAQEHLLQELRRREIDVLVITGDDVAFSSLSYVDYFTGHPAFELVYQNRAGTEDGIYAFRVSRQLLATTPYRAAIGDDTLAALSDEAGLSISETLRAIEPDLRGIR
jgi:hypothetical protein